MLEINPYGDPYPSISELLHMTQQAKKKFMSLPQEEQDRINIQREEEQEQKKG